MLLFRCDRCQTAVWLSQDQRLSVDCSHCGQRYELPEQLRAHSMEQLHNQACGLAKELNVDLPSAVSMMFGVLKLPQVQDFLSGDRPEETTDASAAPAAVVEVDPAFEESIAAGRLSRLEALQRGDRDRFAAQVVSRHGISQDDAYAVADNREVLLAILRRRKASTPRVILAPRRPRVGFKIALVAAAVSGLITLGVSREIQRSANRSIAKESVRAVEDRRTRDRVATIRASAVPTAEPAPELSFDPAGEVTRISAPRPEAVLRAYCRAPELRPIALAPGAMPDKNLWLGMFVDVNDADRSQAVVIRKDRTSGHWFAGDGTHLIQILTPDLARLGEPRLLEEHPSLISAEGNP